MPDILSVADHADMIVNGYAFSKSNDSVRVLNLNNPASACVLSADGKYDNCGQRDILDRDLCNCFSSLLYEQYQTK